MLGMPPVNGYDTSVGPGEQGMRKQAESMLPPYAWLDDKGGALAAGKEVSLVAPTGGLPVEPGGFSVQRILQQVQRGMEGLSKIKEEVQRAGQEAMRRNPGEEERNSGSEENRPRREAAQKAMDALKKGADATRGRGRRKGRMYQRAGVRN